MNQPFTRRRFLVAGAALATTLQLQRSALAADAEVCRLIPEQEEGPYYVGGELVRSNIVEGKPGVPLSLRIQVLDARSCKPLSNAAVDLWHCDALGLYAGFTQQNPMGPGGPRFGGPGGPPPPDDMGPPPDDMGPPPQGMGGPPHNHPTDKLTFLRGIQLTGADGVVVFQTVFPGFYMGRTNHIHFKVRVGGHAEGTSYAAGHTAHTGQLFFPEQVATELMRHEPYSLHRIHRTTQDEDHVFSDQDGHLAIVRLQPGDFAKGMHAELVAAVDPTATPRGVERRGRPPGPPPSS